ncbi:MAG: Fe-S cluster assembly protein SufD [Cyclobacteriaceae bacterium]
MSEVSNKSKTDLSNAFLRQYQRFSEQLNGESNTLLHKVRQSAIQQFEQAGLPGNKHEEYKYTPITRALEKNFSEADLQRETAYTLSQQTKAAIKERLVKTEANHIIFVNGIFQEELSSILSPDKEVLIREFSQAYQETPELIDRYFGKHADVQADPFVALNTAMSRQGLFLHVPKSKVVEKPVIIYFFSDSSHTSVVSHPRNLFLIEENAQVKVAEIFYVLGKGKTYSNPVTEIVMNDRSIAHYYKLPDEGDAAYHTATTQVYQARDSHFHGVNVSLRGAMVRNNLNVVIDAEGCESHMYGLYMLDGDAHVDNHTSVDHKKPNAFSNELYKGIMDGQSRGVFNGKIYVRPDAQKTNAFQSNANILLTDKASIDTKPQLEIWADDVKCSHGATTGQLDKEQMFYLRARGLNAIQARALLLKAFANDVIQHIKIDALREEIEQKISDRLEKEL